MESLLLVCIFLIPLRSQRGTGDAMEEVRHGHERAKNKLYGQQRAY